MSSSEDFQAQLAKSTGKTVETKTSAFISKRKQKSKETAPSIENNPFAIAAKSSADPQMQKDAMVKLMTFVDSKTTEENSKAYAAYNEFMQSQRQEFAVGLMATTDTKTFSGMQSTLLDINAGVLDFEEQMEPFMKIIQAVRLIQEEDATTDILAEMREDGKNTETLQEALNAVNVNISLVREIIKSNRFDIEMCLDDRSFFGYGGVKAEAQTKINKLRAEIKGHDETILAFNAEKEGLRAANKKTTSKFAHLDDAKKTMATMLNLSGGQHEERHEELVQTAIKFVATTKERVTATLGQSAKMGTQIKGLSDLAFTMRGNYSVLAEAAKEAEGINSTAHEVLKDKLEATESSLDKLTLEATSRDMAKHITALNDSASETTAVIADLTVSSQRIENMSAANIAQIKKTEQIQTSGIAGVADNLSSVLTSINQAAIGQASTAAQQSLRRMNNSTLVMTKESMLKAAKDQQNDNNQLMESLTLMVDFGKTVDIANDASRQTLEQSRELVDNYKEIADEVNALAAETLDITSSTISDELTEQ